MRSAYARWLLVATLAVAAGALTGCANDQDTVNRVQPNALKKDTLAGDWYYLQTVIDTPATTSFSFVGEQGNGLQKIRWEVEEDYLFVRRAYEFVAGSEREGPNAPNDAANTTLAMYKILSHFDVRREYNPATGEQTNVVSENTTDRPWNQREFMRVDWSENLVTDGNFLLMNKLLGGVDVESAAFEQTGPNAPVFDKDESGAVYYVDIVNKMFVQPGQTYLDGFGQVPTCLLVETQLCDAGEITVRNSFLKVKDRDYQPLDYSGDRMERFGFFYSDRLGYSDDYGTVHSERRHFANRHNVWEESHRKNEQGQLLGCTNNAQCDDKKGSVCDTAWGLSRRKFTATGLPQGLCTIPYRERKIRPIVYYATHLPAELVPDAANLGTEWNKAFVGMVSSLRENECAAHGGKACAEERKRADHQQIFYVCAAPVAKGAPPACGPEGLDPKPGDLRYHQVVWVGSEEGAGPLGYGPGHADPETGETIMANAFLYGAGVERLAAQGRDLIRVLNNDLTVEELASGSYISGWAQLAHAREEGQTTDEHAVEMTPEMLQRDLAAMDYSWATADVVKTAPRNLNELKTAMDRARSNLHATGALGRGVDEGAARASRLTGTDIEALMVTPDMRMAAGFDPQNADLTEEVLNAASPLRGRSLDSIRAMQHARDIIAEKTGHYDADFGDDGLMGLALAIKAEAAKAKGVVKWYGVDYAVGDGKGKTDYDAVRKMLLHPIFSGLTLHEIGHSVGLRHNFSGSYDALNYAPQYWGLRQDTKMEPRLWDPLTDKERVGRIREYQYSTVMDYGNNFIVSDSHGLGHYDHAAIKMGYGDLVEVFAEAPDQNKLMGVAAVQALGFPIMLDPATNEVLAYTDWPRLVGGIANIEKRVDVPYTSLLANPSIAVAGPISDAKGRTAVPYMFCTDHQADLGPDCMRYDAGSDSYESVQSIVDSYWYYYPIISFARQRVGFEVGSVVNRVHDRYFEKLKRAHQIYALYRPIFGDIFKVEQDDDAFWGAHNSMGAWAGAASAGFRLLHKVIVSPEPGTYGLGKQANGEDLYVSGDSGIKVDPIDGRYLETTYNQDADFFWFEQLDRVGYFYDKVLAIQTLVDPTTYFLGRDTDADIRRWQISYTASFAKPMTALFRGVLAEDWSGVAPRLSPAGDVTYPAIDELVKRSMPGAPLQPNVSFSIQLYASVFGMAYIPQTYDQDFLNSSRLWVQGGAEEIVTDPTATLVTLTDPDSHLVYAAVSYLDAEGLEQGVAASMLNYGNQLFTRAAGKDLLLDTPDDDLVSREAARKFVDNIDLVRRLTWQLGFGAQP